jgi:ankyrin repeat protein
VFKPCEEELLLRITTCLAQNGYHKEVGIMVQLNKAFWTDEQIWDAYKDVPGANGGTRLIYAAAHGLLDRVKWLLARGAVLSGGTEGYSPLSGACDNGQLEVVRFLLARGANVHAFDMSGRTPLMRAAAGNHLEVVRELCEWGADVKAKKSGGAATALTWACQGGCAGAVCQGG